MAQEQTTDTTMTSNISTTSGNTTSQNQTQSTTQTTQPKSSFMSKARESFSKMGSKLNLTKSNQESKENENNPPQKQDPNRLSMEGLLQQARIIFERWVEVHSPMGHPMPHGIAFLTTVKGALGFGGEIGTGVVFYRLPPQSLKDKQKEKEKEKNEQTDQTNQTEGSNNNDVAISSNIKNENESKDNDSDNEDNDNKYSEWSGPCAIGSGSISWGFQVGLSKVDHVIILPKIHHAKTFMSNAQLKLGGNAGLTIVNIGANASGSVNLSEKEISDIHSFTLDSKGLAIGVSIEGAVITIRPDCNEKFYNKKVTVEDIGYGRINKKNEMPKNEDYDKIIRLINKNFKFRKPIGHGPHGPGPHGPHGPPPIAPAIIPPLVGAIIGGPGRRGGPGRGGPHGGGRGRGHHPH